MTVLVALALALGVLLVFDGLTRATPRRRPGIGSRFGAWLAAAGLAQVRPAQFLGVSAALGLAFGVAVLVAVGSTGVALLAVAAGALVPTVSHRRHRRSVQMQRRRVWPDAVELLAGAVRAGDTLTAAVAVVAERGPEPLRPVFAAIVRDHRITGDLVGALERVATSMADPVCDRVVTTLAIAHRVGGRDLGRVLRTLAAFLRDDLAARREIEARQSWTVVAARVAAAAPWVVLLLVSSRAQGARAFDSTAGFAVLVGGALVTVLGYRAMVRVGRLPEEPRVLAVRRG